MSIDWHGVETETGWKYPYINTDTGTWWQWSEDANAYVNTGINAIGYTGDTGPQGERGPKGDPGTSVFVTSITESSEDGGANIVTLSDGHTLTIRNGNTGSRGPAGRDGINGLPGADGETGPQGPKGERGTPGAGVTVIDVSESDVDGGTNIVTFSDGSVLGVKNGNTGSQGPRGYKGERGNPGQNYEITQDDYALIAEVVLSEVDDVVTQAIEDINDEKAGAISDIEDKGEEVLESIPEDYSELSADVSSLRSDLNDVVSGVVFPYLHQNWVEGFIYSSFGGDNDESAVLEKNRRTAYLSGDVVGVNINSGYYFRVYAYQQDDTYVGVWNGSGYQKSGYNLTTNLYFGTIFGDYKLRLAFGKVSGETITNADLANIELLTYINKSLPSEIVNIHSLAGNMSANVVPGLYEVQTITWGADNKYINPNNGVISDAGTANVHVSDYVDISQVPYIRLTASPYYSFCCLAFYDANKAFLRAYPSSSSNVNYWMEEIEVPSTAKYAVFGNNSAINGKLAVKIEFMTTYASLLCRKWIGKKWACVGDSLTEINDRASMRYMDYIQIATGIKPYNMGVSGTGYANGHANSKAFLDRIVNVPTDSDVVTIFGSNNDMFGSGWDVGNITDTGTSTLCGFINGTIDALYTAFPRAILGVITPSPWNNIYPSGSDSLCTKGIAYAKALVDICAYRGIPCLDLFHCSGMRPWEPAYRAIYYTNDDGNGVHPNELGQKILASHILAFLETLII